MNCLAVLLLSVINPTQGYPHPPSNDDGITVHGSILDLNTRLPVNADVQVFYNSDFNADFSGKARQGEFTILIKKFGWFIISIDAPGYLESTDTLWVVNEKRKFIDKNFYIAPVEVGRKVTLNNIYFNFGKTSLSGQSFPELDKLVKFIKENPGVSFEIAGHTDTEGPEDYNLILSQERAQAVVNYLVSHGVEHSRLVSHGYGETRPVDMGVTKEAQSRNRRVELTVLNMGVGGSDRKGQ